jgi:hypothetical protein
LEFRQGRARPEVGDEMEIQLQNGSQVRCLPGDSTLRL